MSIQLLYVLWTRKSLNVDHLSESTYLTRKSALSLSHGGFLIGGSIQILHARPERWLNRLRMPPKQIHHQRPTKRRKDWPSTTRRLIIRIRHQSTADRQLCQSERDTGKHVNDDLLVDAALFATPKHEVSAQQSSDEGICTSFFSAVCAAERIHCGFVERHEGCEVAGVLAGCFEY